jgi:hypothetical protein
MTYSNFDDEDMLPEYKFDYTKARPNRFAEKHKSEKNDSLKSEYDLSDLQVRRTGEGRKVSESETHNIEAEK